MNKEIKCENCGKEIKHIITRSFDRFGNDFEDIRELTEYEVDAVGFDIDKNWCGYDLTENEQRELIECPYCHKYPFENNEIQIYEIVRVIGFKTKLEE